MHILYKSILYFPNVTLFYTTQLTVTVQTKPSPLRKLRPSVRRFSRASECQIGVVGTLFWILCRWGEKRRKYGQNLLCAWSAGWLYVETVVHRIVPNWYDTDILIYLLTAVGLTPGGSSTVHSYTNSTAAVQYTVTQTVQQQYSTQLHKQYTERHS
jgi:hypothetical protein